MYVLLILVKYKRLLMNTLVTNEYIVTEKGTIEKKRYYIPQNLVDYFGGITLYFKLTKEEANKYKKG
jgi:hypothetical protein